MYWFSTLLYWWALPSCIARRIPRDDHASSPLNEAFEKKVNWALDHFSIPGLAVSVVRGEDIFAKGYGISNTETSKPVTEHTLFEGASTTKAFTAAAMSLLVDDNENYPDIQWATPVHDLLPEFVLEDPWTTTHVTLEDILSHRSGLPRHDWIANANITIQEVISKLRYAPLTAPIRTQWQYTNLLYMTAGYLIETQTGQPLKEFLRSRIWEPLNMTETYFTPTDAQAANEDIAKGYYVDSDHQFKDAGYPSPKILRGASGVLSSATDYAKWLRAMIHRRPPLSAAGHAAVTSAHSIILPTSYKGHAVVQHTGAIYGFGSMVIFLPDVHLGITIMGNNLISTNAVASVLAYHIIDEVLGIPEEDRFDWAKEYLPPDPQAEKVLNVTITPDPRSLYPTIPNPPLPPPLPVASITGLYTHPAYPTLNFTESCSQKSIIPPLTNATTAPRLCMFFVNPAELPESLIMEIVHVSGDDWIFGSEYDGIATSTKVEIKVGPDGLVERLGIEADGAMAALGEKIWWAKSD
ncbi:putative penicillin-binding protein [Aspergillus nomiae NRRL 13137]|uniref:Putative penicillin-binding protein n=1 Tax=Aspergillus nomiae NRRL (strain ATCC 15546 / NRRL 13137 / CBS 260.88 / M93) TaxID=1509407 RepID=A0A0L1JET6_ASPN3|nr:putative penicillin-binding protein [Aspergillus nomiae NRRL 13137]KNG89873.1 putative penicillin-binding protein [Aspergillus nomiae NRRL 13137]